MKVEVNHQTPIKQSSTNQPNKPKRVKTITRAHPGKRVTYYYFCHTFDSTIQISTAKLKVSEPRKTTNGTHVKRRSHTQMVGYTRTRHGLMALINCVVVKRSRSRRFFHQAASAVGGRRRRESDSGMSNDSFFMSLQSTHSVGRSFSRFWALAFPIMMGLDRDQWTSHSVQSKCPKERINNNVFLCQNTTLFREPTQTLEHLSLRSEGQSPLSRSHQGPETTW